jgi:hypothetical protein
MDTKYVPENYRRVMRWTLLGAVVGIALGLFLDVAGKWHLIAMVSLLPAYVWALGSAVGSTLSRKLGGRLDNAAFVVAAIIVLPIYSFAAGDHRATELYEGRKYQYVAAGAIEGVPQEEVANKRHLRFVGKAGDFVFFLMPDGQTVLVSPIDQVTGLQLKSHKAALDRGPPSAPAKPKDEGKSNPPTPAGPPIDAAKWQGLYRNSIGEVMRVEAVGSVVSIDIFASRNSTWTLKTAWTTHMIKPDYAEFRQRAEPDGLWLSLLFKADGALLAVHDPHSASEPDSYFQKLTAKESRQITGLPRP